MSEHTPWRWERKGCQVKDRNGHKVAEISVSRIGDPELESRGQLFAAAPETARQRDDLVAAAEPFADVIVALRTYQDNAPVVGNSMHNVFITAGQFRAIAAAVAATKGE